MSTNTADVTPHGSGDNSKFYKMKLCTAAIEDYLETKLEDKAITIGKTLQVLSVSVDVSVFDPHTNVAAKFFITLHQLLNRIEPRSPVAWYCVDVLINSCRNSSARQALIDRYHFIPPLTRLLNDQLTIGKQVRLLRLFQDLSCGIKISWQFPHLCHLITSLVKWVSSPDEDVATLSLGVIVNLCYKNHPAIYILMKNVDIKRFLRTCMPLQGPIIEEYTCKLLIILDFMNGEKPESTVLKLVPITFKSLIAAFKKGDSILLRQIVEFFIDVRKNNVDAQTINSYQHYEEEVKRLLEVVGNCENKNEKSTAEFSKKNSDCIAIVFQFLLCLIEHLPRLKHFYPTFIKLALKWIQTDIASTQALSLMRFIAVNTEPKDNIVLEPLIEGLPIFLLGFNSINEECVNINNEYCKNLSSLLELLHSLVKVDSVRPKILEYIQEEIFLKLFQPVLGDDTLLLRAIDSLSIEAINMFVLAIYFIKELSTYDTNWINLQKNLMKNKQIYILLARALYQSQSGIKKAVLDISASSYCSEDILSDCMCSLQSSMVLNETKTERRDVLLDHLVYPMVSVAKVEQLDDTLNRIKNIIAGGNVQSLLTSEILELYEFKIATTNNAERIATASLEAASERCIQLQHHVAQVTAESHRLHQILLHAQQCHEQAGNSITLLKEQCKDLTNKVEAEKGRVVACTSQLRLKESELEETRKKVTEIANSNSNLKQVISKLEKNCQKMEENYNRAHANSTNLKSQVQDLELILNKKDAEIQSKSNELEEIMKELMSKKHIIDSITRLTNSQIDL